MEKSAPKRSDTLQTESKSVEDFIIEASFGGLASGSFYGINVAMDLNSPTKVTRQTEMEHEKGVIGQSSDGQPRPRRKLKAPETLYSEAIRAFQARSTLTVGPEKEPKKRRIKPVAQIRGV